MRTQLQAIALLVTTASFLPSCIPPKTSDVSDDSAAKASGAKDVKYLVHRSTTKAANGFEMVFSTADKVASIKMCDQRAALNCVAGAPGFQELVPLVTKKQGYFFYNKEPAILFHNSHLYVFTKVDGEDYKLSRHLEIATFGWNKVSAIMTKSCAGAACHVGGNQADLFSTSELLTKNSKTIYARLVNKTMPPPNDPNAKLADGERTIILDYLKVIDPIVDRPDVFTWPNVLEVTQNTCGGSKNGPTCHGPGGDSNRLDLTSEAVFRSSKSKLLFKLAPVVGTMPRAPGAFRSDDERKKYLAFITSM